MLIIGVTSNCSVGNCINLYNCNGTLYIIFWLYMIAVLLCCDKLFTIGNKTTTKLLFTPHFVVALTFWVAFFFPYIMHISISLIIYNWWVCYYFSYCQLFSIARRASLLLFTYCCFSCIIIELLWIPIHQAHEHIHTTHYTWLFIFSCIMIWVDWVLSLLQARYTQMF